VAPVAGGPRSGKTVLDLAVTLAMGGDCLSDIGILREQPDVCGPVASDPTVSRLVTALAGSGPKAVAAFHGARAAVRERDGASPGQCRRSRTGG
jgi:hypothetical protein